MALLYLFQSQQAPLSPKVGSAMCWSDDLAKRHRPWAATICLVEIVNSVLHWCWFPTVAAVVGPYSTPQHGPYFEDAVEKRKPSRVVWFVWKSSKTWNCMMIWGASRWIAIRFPSVAWFVWRRRLWSFCNVMGGLRKSRALLELIWFFLRVLYCSSISPCTMIQTRNSYTHLWFTSHTGHGMVIKPNLMGLQIHEKDFYSQRNNRG